MDGFILNIIVMTTSNYYFTLNKKWSIIFNKINLNSNLISIIYCDTLGHQFLDPHLKYTLLIRIGKEVYVCASTHTHIHSHSLSHRHIKRHRQMYLLLYVIVTTYLRKPT
jgi:hypothetical protein